MTSVGGREEWKRDGKGNERLTASELDDVVEFGVVTVFNHAISLVDNEELDALDLANEEVGLQKGIVNSASIRGMEGRKRTSPIKSQRRPGVATTMSAPFSNCLFCLSTLIPPVKHTTFTNFPLYLFLGSSSANASSSGVEGRRGRVRTAREEREART
jgi:hypothetical protein